METKNYLVKGKAKDIYTVEGGQAVMEYKTDSEGENVQRKKNGVLNHRLSAFFFELLAKEGIKSHFDHALDDSKSAITFVNIFPIEIVVRNIAAGGLMRRLGLKEGEKLKSTVLEYFYKNDSLLKPLINDYHIAALGLATLEEMLAVTTQSFKINSFLTKFLKNHGIDLVDFKLEFGKTDSGEILLADEISAETCRMTDAETGMRLSSVQLAEILLD